MTTNGTLMTEDVIEFLVKYEFNLMISLDGDKKSHDINRRFKTGKGSFDIILENLSRLKAYSTIQKFCLIVLLVLHQILKIYIDFIRKKSCLKQGQ